MSPARARSALRRPAPLRGRAREAAGEEVEGNVLFPDGLFDDRPAVVRERVGRRGRCHSSPPKKAAATPTASTPAATAAAPQIVPTCLVGTIGCGGNP